MNILVATVGGSCTPIVNAIRTHQPDFVVFICSDDDPISGTKGSYVTVDSPHNPCNTYQKPPRPSIVAQTGLQREQYEIIRLRDADDLNSAYRVIYTTLKDLLDRYPDARIIADYTGGTKTMSAALVLAGVNLKNRGIQLSLVKGARSNLVKVEDPDAAPSLVDTIEIRIDELIHTVQILFERYDYAAARELIESFYREESSRVSTGIRQQLECLRYFFRGLDYWDRFEHINAWNTLNYKSIREHIPELHTCLLRVIKSRAEIDEAFQEEVKDLTRRPIKTYHRYELLADLVQNARRRYIQKRFDDAVARLYRALELAAQMLLKHRHGIDTSQVPELPETCKHILPDSVERREIGLIKSHDLLACLEKDTLQPLWKKQRPEIMNALKARNHSILAHGFRPVTEQEYREVEHLWIGYIEATIRLLEVPDFSFDSCQLPQEIPDVFLKFSE